MQDSVPHVWVLTCEEGVVYDVFTRVVYTCDVFVSAVTRVCVRYSGVLHVCSHTMLDSTTPDKKFAYLHKEVVIF